MLSVSPRAHQGYQTDQAPDLLDVASVAEKLGGCSKKHVQRLSDAGKMPAPVRLGRLLRWSRVSIDQWIADGCPPVPEKRRGAK